MPAIAVEHHKLASEIARLQCVPQIVNGYIGLFLCHDLDCFCKGAEKCGLMIAGPMLLLR
jgi:hypothetical protein